MNCATVDISALSKDALCLTGMVNRVLGGGGTVNVSANHRRAFDIKRWFTPLMR